LRSFVVLRLHCDYIYKSAFSPPYNKSVKTMPELPFHLKTIEPVPGALDILRYLGALDQPYADAYTICDTLGLSDRGFSKAIKRLVTKGYVQMDGDRIYRLTQQGNLAVEELAAFDEESPGYSANSASRNVVVERHLVMVVPRIVVAGQATDVQIGFTSAANGSVSAPADVVVRLSVVNGEPSRDQVLSYQLSGGAAHKVVSIQAGRYTQIRIKAQVFQIGPNEDDINPAGGMYVDVYVAASADEADSRLIAYGADVSLMAF
jgi:predicted transcriptional regulator